MTQDEYLLLFEKFLSGKATAEELDILLSYKDQFALSADDTEADTALLSETEARILAKLKSSISKEKEHNIRHLSLWVAASVSLIVMFAAIFFNHRTQKPVMLAVKKPIIENDIKPASKDVLLTLAGGKQIILNNVQTGTVLHQGGMVAKKADSRVVTFNPSATDQSIPATPEYVTITTPVGGHYEVVLADGSKVWLNAASSLTFPSAFTSNERRVELTGEAYFEVAKNKTLPFKVKFNNELVEVLGTHFNIMAYKGDAVSTTTLLEGSVSITKNNVKKLLVPGQHAIVGVNKDYFNISVADEEEAIAWKDNLFLFHDENIKEIMKHLARWYDVEVVYQGSTERKNFGIRMSKSKNLSEVLKNLELTGTVHFNIKGRRVTVME